MPVISDNALDHEIAQGPLLKIERAKEHVRDLDRQLTEYMAKKPFELRIGQCEDPPRRVIYVETKEPIPSHLPLIFADAVHNLRTALDHLCFSMVGDKTEVPARVGFPFAKAGGDSLKGAIATRQMHLAPEKVIDEIYNLNPYPGGNNRLNAVKVLDERDKHHVILTVGTALVFTVPQLAALVGPEKVVHLPPHLELSTVGDFSVELTPPFEIFDKKADFQPPFTVGLANDEALGNAPIALALKWMVQATTRAVVRLVRAFVE